LNILLTGSTGFIGRNFRQFCLSSGDSILNIGRGISNPDDFFYSVDDSSLVTKLTKFKPDIVVDLATHFDLSPIDLENKNLIEGAFTFHVVLSHKLRFLEIPWVYTSSYWQYLRKADGSYISDYHFLKSSVADYLGAQHSGRFQSISLMDTYGEGDRRKKIVRLLMELQPSDSPIQLSEGNQFLNLLHIKDVCVGLYKVCQNVTSGGISSSPEHLISSEFITLKELVAKVELIRNVQLPVQWGVKPYRAGEILSMPNLSNVVSGWRQEISLREGLSKFL